MTPPILSRAFTQGFEEGEYEGHLMGEQRGYRDGFIDREVNKPSAFMMHVDNIFMQLVSTLNRQKDDYADKKYYYDGYCQGLKHGFTEGFKDGADEYAQMND